MDLNLSSDPLLNDTIDDDLDMNLTGVARPHLTSPFPYPSLHSWHHIVLASLFVSAIMAAIVIGNGLVVVAISVDKSLKGLQNWFVASLAVSDLLVGLFIMPLSLANELMGYWYFGDTICELWLSTDVLLCTASILNLCLISLDRYWSITRAITYIKQRTRNRAILMISIVWLLSMTICFPPLVGWKRPQPTMLSGFPLCILSEEPGYVVYSSIGSFYLPLVVMFLVYFKIYKAARKRARRNLSRCGGVAFPEKTLRSRLMRRTTFSNSVPEEESGTPRIGSSKSIAVSSQCQSDQRNGKQLIMEKDDCFNKGMNARDEFLPPANQSPNDSTIVPPSDRPPMADAVKDANPEEDDCLERSGSISIRTSVELHRNAACHSARSTLSSETATVFHDDEDDEAPSGTESECLQHHHPHCHHHRLQQQPQHPLDGARVDRRPLALQLLIARCGSVPNSTRGNSSSSVDLDKDAAVSVGASLGVRRTISHLPDNFLQYIPAILSRRHLTGFTHSPHPPHPQQQQPQHHQDRRHLASADFDRAKRRVARAKERRAIVVLGIVMASFVGCWLPFFSIYPIMSVAGLEVPSSVFAVIFWLGYCNSALNPIIYTIFNQDFRNAFAHILFRRRASYRHQT